MSSNIMNDNETSCRIHLCGMFRENRIERRATEIRKRSPMKGRVRVQG